MPPQNSKVKKRPGKKIHSAVFLHANEKAREILHRFGPVIDYPTVLKILEDRKSTRYPVTLHFTTDAIEPGMYGMTRAVSENPDDGYIVSLHSALESRHDVLPALILYQLVMVNYGDLATANDAEIFGATILQMDREDYYRHIVDLTNALWA